MGYAEEFEKWLDDDLETLEHCSPRDRVTIEKIVTAWAQRPARAVAVRLFFANWATTIAAGGTWGVDWARRHAQQALRLDDKYRRLREKCDALLGGQRELPPSILESRAFWERAQLTLAAEREPLTPTDAGGMPVADSRPPDRLPSRPSGRGFWKLLRRTS